MQNLKLMLEVIKIAKELGQLSFINKNLFCEGLYTVSELNDNLQSGYCESPLGMIM